MSRVVVIRHGQSVWNAENKFTGVSDPELSPKGHKDAEDIGRKLNSEFNFNMAYVSPRIRAVQTAKYIKSEKTVIVDEIQERDYGDLTGLNKTEVAAKYGEQTLHIWRRSLLEAPSNGESLLKVCIRVQYFIDNYLFNNLEVQGHDTLIVSHGNVLRAFMFVIGAVDYSGLPYFNIDVGQYFVLRFENNAFIIDEQEDI